MSEYGKEELTAILELCSGRNIENPMHAAAAARDWIADQDIDVGEFMEISKAAGEAGEVTLKMADLMGLGAVEAMAAVFAAGFEFGVRFQQHKEILI